MIIPDAPYSAPGPGPLAWIVSTTGNVSGAHAEPAELAEKPTFLCDLCVERFHGKQRGRRQRPRPRGIYFTEIGNSVGDGAYAASAQEMTVVPCREHVTLSAPSALMMLIPPLR